MVGTLLTVEDYLITPTLLNFHQKYPGVKVSVFGLRTGDIHKQLIENKLDLGIVFLPMKGDELESISLSTEEMAFAVPKGHPLENQDMLDVEVLKTTPSILLPQQYFIRNLIDEACKDLGFFPKPIFEITTMQSLINMVIKGVGVTILPKPYLEYLNHPHIRIIPILKPNLSREIGVVYRKDKYLSAATHVFISALKETVCKPIISRELD